jgi:predicted XRE-type DNA-binding protein
VSKAINDQIVEYQQSQQEAAEALSVAQSRVNELQALLHRQTGAITALQRVAQEQAANSNGAVVLDADCEAEAVVA